MCTIGHCIHIFDGFSWDLDKRIIGYGYDPTQKVWVMDTCWVLCSRLTYFWRNMDISGFFYFSKSTSINTQYSSLWDTPKVMLFTKYLKKWKRIGRISRKYQYWFNLKSSLELIRYENTDITLVQCPFKDALWCHLCKIVAFCENCFCHNLHTNKVYKSIHF